MELAVHGEEEAQMDEERTLSSVLYNMLLLQESLECPQPYVS